MSQDLKTSPAQWRINSWFQYLTSDQREKLQFYHTELGKWSKAINLISPKSWPEADRIHFADSIEGCSFVSKELDQQNEVWDVGSGNGFPGIVLAILNDKLLVRCLDSDERKISFLRQLSLNLNLNVKTTCLRLEDFDLKIQQAVARGFAPLGKFLSLAKDKFDQGSTIFHFKGAEWERELSESKDLSSLWETKPIGEYKLPVNDLGISEGRVILRSRRL